MDPRVSIATKYISCKILQLKYLDYNIFSEVTLVNFKSSADL